MGRCRRVVLVYGGYSAGTCVTTPGLEGIHLMDDPEVIPHGYLKDVPPRTLQLVPWRIVPHWRSSRERRCRKGREVSTSIRIGLPNIARRGGLGCHRRGVPCCMTGALSPGIGAVIGSPNLHIEACG
jgi:hypothetical protein